MKKWQLELIVFIILMFIVFLLTGTTGGYNLGASLALPVVVITWIIGKTWDKLHPKYVCKICGFKTASEEKMKDHILKVHNKEEIKKAEEYRTLPAQATQQTVRHTTKKDKIEKLEKKNSNYGLLIAIIIGLALFSVLVYALNILGAIIYFIVFYLLERHYERKNKLLYYTGYYALRVGAVMVIIAIILVFMFLLGVFSSPHFSSTLDNVHITDINYYYTDLQTGYNWTYSVPINSNVSEGSTLNGSVPFTDNLSCGITMISAYSLTQGFTFQIHGLPETFEPRITKDLNITMTFPSYPYSGPVDVKGLVTYGGNC